MKPHVNLKCYTSLKNVCDEAMKESQTTMYIEYGQELIGPCPKNERTMLLGPSVGLKPSLWHDALEKLVACAFSYA